MRKRKEPRVFSERPRRLEVHVAYDCVNRCLFCSEEGPLRRIKEKFMPLARFRDLLTIFRKKGFDHVTLTGGEPTMHPDFIELLRTAKDLGYTTYVTTNGTRMSRKEFCDNALPWLDEVCFSVHGPDAKVHDRHTRRRGSFLTLKRALENFERAAGGTQGYVNTVITRYNLPFLSDVIEFVGRYKKIRQVLFSNLAPEGRGLRDFKRLHVRLGDLKTRVEGWLATAQRHSLVLRFFGVPLCVMGRHPMASNDMWWSSRVTVERGLRKGRAGHRITYSFVPTRKRTKVQGCRRCVLFRRCAGVFRRYIEERGSKEFGMTKGEGVCI